MSCILIASAGTGGHIFPALALAEALKNQEPEVRIIFVRAGRKRFDDSACGELGETRWVPGTGMPRKFSVRLPIFVFQTVRSLFRSLAIIKGCRPDIVVGFGNFGSYGPVRAAAFRCIPIFLHEANSIAGKANRVLAKFARCVGVNFPDANKWFTGRRVEVVGAPIREEFKKSRQREEAIKYFCLDRDKPVLLVMGGSQGAQHINEVVCGMLPRLQRLGVQVIHLTGEDEFEKVGATYSACNIGSAVRAFENRMKLAFDAADIVVSRAGASSIAEISATGKPAVLVPFPFATDNHQFYNAKYLSDRHGAIMIEDKDMTIGSLFEKLELLIKDEKKQRELSENCMKLSVPDSADRMAQIVLEMAGKQGK